MKMSLGFLGLMSSFCLLSHLWLLSHLRLAFLYPCLALLCFVRIACSSLFNLVDSVHIISSTFLATPTLDFLRIFFWCS